MIDQLRVSINPNGSLLNHGIGFAKYIIILYSFICMAQPNLFFSNFESLIYLIYNLIYDIYFIYFDIESNCLI